MTKQYNCYGIKCPMAKACIQKQNAELKKKALIILSDFHDGHCDYFVPRKFYGD